MCVCVCVSVLRAVERINGAIRKGVAEETVNELMNPDAQLPQVYPSAADLYQRELASLQQQSAEVKTHKHTISAYYFAITIFLETITVSRTKRASLGFTLQNPNSHGP